MTVGKSHEREDFSPPSGKKTPSPTKIRQPQEVMEESRVCEEVISPVLEVEAQRPGAGGAGGGRSDEESSHDDEEGKGQY